MSSFLDILFFPHLNTAAIYWPPSAGAGESSELWALDLTISVIDESRWFSRQFHALYACSAQCHHPSPVAPGPSLGIFTRSEQASASIPFR